MRYVRTTKIEHSLEMDGDELQDFLREGLRTSNGDIIEPPDPEPLAIRVVIPGGGDYSNMAIPVGDMKFLATWEEEIEEVEE